MRMVSVTFLAALEMPSLQRYFRNALLIVAHLLVEVHRLSEGFSVVKDFIVILHFEADIACGRD
jgi:hypothetical protein